MWISCAWTVLAGWISSNLLQRAACPAVLHPQARQSVDFSMQQYEQIVDKLDRLSQSEGWGDDATLALDAAGKFVHHAFLTSTDEGAIALMDELLQQRGKWALLTAGHVEVVMYVSIQRTQAPHLGAWPAAALLSPYTRDNQALIDPAES